MQRKHERGQKSKRAWDEESCCAGIQVGKERVGKPGALRSTDPSTGRKAGDLGTAADLEGHPLGGSSLEWLAGRWLMADDWLCGPACRGQRPPPL